MMRIMDALIIPAFCGLPIVFIAIVVYLAYLDEKDNPSPVPEIHGRGCMCPRCEEEADYYDWMEIQGMMAASDGIPDNGWDPDEDDCDDD